jgi:hypothetical protein
VWKISSAIPSGSAKLKTAQGGVGEIFDVAALDPSGGQALVPGVELGAVGNCQRQVIKPGAVRGELLTHAHYAGAKRSPVRNRARCGYGRPSPARMRACLDNELGRNTDGHEPRRR